MLADAEDVEAKLVGKLDLLEEIGETLLGRDQLAGGGSLVLTPKV